jgi:zinc transport system ATP-binding protein
MSDGPVVTMKDVAFSYGGRSVLERVSFDIAPLDFVGIVGPNGGGKTTLLRLMLGLLEPDSGTVLLFGDRPQRTRARVGYVPQFFGYDPQFPATVMDVTLAGRLGTSSRIGPYSTADKAAASEALSAVDVGELRDRHFHDLSGGQRQRVLIARALTANPDALMLDEPTANVDATVEDELYRLLKDLNRSMTILMVSHDLGFVSGVVKNVLCVHGHVATHATCDVGDVGAEYLKKMYGHDVRAVQHDHPFTGDCECSNS